MSNLTDYAEAMLLDWYMTAGAVSRPTTWYLALFTTATTDAGGGTEVSGFGYARQAITFGAASSPAGSTASTNSQTFTASGGAWGTVSHMAIFDALTGGNMLWHSALSSSKGVSDGESLIFATGAVTLTLA